MFLPQVGLGLPAKRLDGSLCIAFFVLVLNDLLVLSYFSSQFVSLAQQCAVKLYKMRFFFSAATLTFVSLLFSSFTFAQLSGSVGPTTSTASKAAKKVCNVLSYGAKADRSTDLGPPLASAFAACKSGGIGMSKSHLETPSLPNTSKCTFLQETTRWPHGRP